MPKSPAQRTYNRRVIVLSVVYAAFLFPVVYLFKHEPPTGPIAYALAVLPALPIVGVFGAIGRYLVEERDEYLRQQMIRQVLVASGITLPVAMVVGFLESFALVPPIHAYWFAILWFAGLGFGEMLNKIAERAA